MGPLIFVTDSHFKAKNPVGRKDDYMGAIAAKFIELSGVARSVGASAVLHGGDMFDIPRVSDMSAGLLAEILRTFPCPIYVVPGSHDMYGYNVDSIEQTKLGLLAKAGLIELLMRSRGPVRIGDVSIEAQEHVFDMDSADPSNFYFATSDGPSILVCHSMLVKDSLNPSIPHTLTSSVASIKDRRLPDLVLSGHYHAGFPAHQIGSILFANPGSMARKELIEENRDRIPSYLIVTYTGDRFRLEERKFESAKPDVLDFSIKARPVLFVSAVGPYMDDDDDKVDVVSAILSSKMSDGALEDVKARLADMTDLIGWEVKVPESRVRLTSVSIRNFQSHADTRITFSPNLNVIVGTNDAGKTAIIRAIRWVLFDRPRGPGIVSSWSDSCEVSVSFSNGYTITKTRTKKSPGRYTITKPDGTTVSYNQSAPPPEVTEITGLLYEDGCINMAMASDAPFLVGLSPTQAAEAIGKLIRLDVADAIISQARLEVQALVKERKSLKEKLDKVASDISVAEPEIRELSEKVEAVEVILGDLKAARSKLEELESLKDNIDEANFELGSVRACLRACQPVLSAAAEVDEVERAFDRLREMSSLQSEMLSAVSELKELELRLARLSGLPDTSPIKDLLVELQALEVVRKELQLVQAELEQAENSLFEANMRRVSLETERDKLLNTIGRCPVCGSIMGGMKSGRPESY